MKQLQEMRRRQANSNDVKPFNAGQQEGYDFQAYLMKLKHHLPQSQNEVLAYIGAGMLSIGVFKAMFA